MIGSNKIHLTMIYNKTKLFSLSASLIVSSLLSSATALAQQPPDVPALVKVAAENGRKSKLLTEYTYIWRTQQTSEKKGKRKESSITYEAYSPTLKNKGTTRFVMIKTKQDDQPLPADKLEKERQRGVERLMKAEEDAQQINRQHQEEPPANSTGVYFSLSVNRLFGGDVTLNVKTILQSCDFDSPRQETIDGRSVIALGFRPKPDAKFEKEEAFLAQTVGTVWIDEKDKIVARVEGWPNKSSERKAQPAFVYKQMRLDDGVWLPSSIQINGLAYSELFGKLNTDYLSDFTDYKRFGSEVKDVKLKDPTKQN